MSAAIQDNLDYFLKDYAKYFDAYEDLTTKELFYDLLFCLNDYRDANFDESLAILILINERLYSKTAEDLFYYYMGKQALTQFRQANGYKSGDYIKNWLGKEDNEHLTEMLEKGVSVEYIPTALEDAYSLVVRNA